MNRVTASFINLFASSLIFGALYFFVTTRWHPAPYFVVTGGALGIKMAAIGVLALGPLLTFIVFNKKKSIKKIKGDLVVIALVQVLVSTGIAYTLYNQRPLAIVFWEDSFYTVPASTLSNQNFNVNDFKQPNGEGPPFIYAQKPRTAAKLKEVANLVLRDKTPPYQQVHLYQPFQDHFSSITTRQVNIEEIINTNVQMEKDLLLFLTVKNKHIKDYLYFPLRSKYGNLILIFNPKGALNWHIKVPLNRD